MSEKLLQQKLQKFCKQNTLLVYKFASPSHRGVPDLLVFGRGRVALIEVKNPNGNGRLSALQERTIAHIQAQDIPVYVIDNYAAGCEAIAETFGLSATGRD